MIPSLLVLLGIVPATGPEIPLVAGPDTSCIVMGMSVAGRASPLDSLTFAVDGHPVKLCYGRPSARGRTMIGGRDIPWGKLWRTGANEPTMLHTTIPVVVAGIRVEPGSYSLYTVPGPDAWELVINASITQWGHIARYTRRVRQQELGRAPVSSERVRDHVETMRFRAEPSNGGATLLLEWEHTRVRIPVRPAGGGT